MIRGITFSISKLGHTVSEVPYLPECIHRDHLKIKGNENHIEAKDNYLI